MGVQTLNLVIEILFCDLDFHKVGRALKVSIINLNLVLEI